IAPSKPACPRAYASSGASSTPCSRHMIRRKAWRPSWPSARRSSRTNRGRLALLERDDFSSNHHLVSKLLFLSMIFSKKRWPLLGNHALGGSTRHDRHAGAGPRVEGPHLLVIAAPGDLAAQFAVRGKAARSGHRAGADAPARPSVDEAEGRARHI